MTFRGRLRLFFTIIVVVPMIAVALVLFALTRDSETGKADAGIAGGLRVAYGVHREAATAAEPTLRGAARDRRLGEALQRGRLRDARARMGRLLSADPRLVAIDFRLRGGGAGAHAGSPAAVAVASAPLSVGGRTVGVLSVSLTRAADYARRVSRLSGKQVSLARGRRVLASTVPGLAGAPESAPLAEARDFHAGGRDYRGRVGRLSDGAGAPLRVAVFEPSSELSASIRQSRVLIGAILLAFLALALLFSVFVSRALQDQIGQFLAAARRLARGDFKQRVPTSGSDEFAALGREFNSMSEQLEAKIEEVQRKRRELEDTIRRVGEAFASGLDRQGVVELAVRTAVDACEAVAGRAHPVDRAAFRHAASGPSDDRLEAALVAAERDAFAVSPGVAHELLEPVPDVGPGLEQRGASAASVAGAHALAVAMRARLGSRSSAQYAGVMSIARHEPAFTRQEKELLEYLASQAVVSIENAHLHQTVQRQAVTDELTGLANVRELHLTLDRELERARRFDTPLGFVMLDIDDFKKVNDVYGHQQGDVVLVHVARVLRQLSRDIDEPARYGGEELVVVLPETDDDGALQLAERIREAVEELRIPQVDGGGHLRVTASFGAASVPGSAFDKQSLIAAADEALYRAKRAGKNRAERAHPAVAPR